MTRHPLDPTAQHDAAVTLGRADADGLLPPGEAPKIMRAIVNAAFRIAPLCDKTGLRTRLVWAARDARRDRINQRANTETAIRWATRAMIQGNALPELVMEAARRAAGTVMIDHEIRAILSNEWIRARRKGRK